jgi:hypothetical protein
VDLPPFLVPRLKLLPRRRESIRTSEYLGYPRDYYATYCDNVAAVTKEDVLKVAEEHLRPNGSKILVVGNPDSFDEGLAKFGEVEEIKLGL